MATWDRFDICLAHQCLENDWNMGGWLQERPSNRRRMEATHVQLDRMGYSSPYGPSSFDHLLGHEEYENAADIYVQAMVSFGMGRLLTNDPDDELVAHIKRVYTPEWVAQNFLQLISKE
jgi:hypothetical protein